MNLSESHELVHECSHELSMNDKLQFTNHFVRELPFVVHGLFMKMFMNQISTSTRVHQPTDS